MAQSTSRREPLASLALTVLSLWLVASCVRAHSQANVSSIPDPGAGSLQSTSNSSKTNANFHVQVSAIHVDKAEFPLAKLLFRLTLRLALESLERRLASRKIKISINVRSANTCSRQYASAVAAEEYYMRRARMFIVSGCNDAIRGVSRLATTWRVPVMTAAGFGADLSDKTLHKSLLRVAFSLDAAVEFLFKIMKSLHWRRANLIVDQSDSNSQALRDSVEKSLANSWKAGNNSQLELSTISLDFRSMASLAPNGLHPNSSLRNESYNLNPADDWPNEYMNRAIIEALRQSSLFSRVTILLIPQQHLRKFMLSAYDQNMANGLYTFINMPLLMAANDDQVDESLSSASTNYSRNSYVGSTGENVFAWRSLRSSRNSQAKQAFESLMSIYLKTPTTKAYIYFASKLTALANQEYATTTSTTTQAALIRHQQMSPVQSPAKIQLNINPYSASFYDCVQIYAIALEELLRAMDNETDQLKRHQLRQNLHSEVINSVRGRRYDNLLTGNIYINENGDRETDYTLDDMNQMTGKFSPVILFRGASKELERISRIHWSSDAEIGPTIDDVDCNLIGTCPSKPISKFLVTTILLALPLTAVTISLLYFLHKHISLESQLVDYWWRISYKDIEIIATRRKNLVDGSSVLVGAESQTSSQVHGQSLHQSEKGAEVAPANKSNFDSEVNKTTFTGLTTNTSAFDSSAMDVCYGNISLGIYKLNKVALRPIGKFHSTRKVLIEIRSIKEINHTNLCRFVGIVIDESREALVSEFCPKGSLREFFRNGNMVIDWTFKYSIINDIMAGLNYLHSSPMGFHGRLRSSNCLVSARFVVKLSDYGPHSLFEQIDGDEEDYNLMKKLIFLAPEHMKLTGKTNGSEKGDVYSMGLLLYEIITGNLPFHSAEGNDEILPMKTLFDELKANGVSEKVGIDFKTPDSDGGKSLDDMMALAKSCLEFGPQARPSLVVVSTALKNITRGVTSKKLLENLTSRMEQYTNNLESLVDAKLAVLVEEKLKTEELLYQFVPRSIATLLKDGHSIEPEAFDCVTVFYSDIVGFTSLSSESTPMEVIDFLSDLYNCFDEILEQHDIFKVDTIGDAYIVASGLPQRNEGKHVIEIACVALALRERLNSFKIPHKPNRRLQMRVGIHSGPCVAGIVGGSNMPKYCVFGDTLSTGKFMESSGLPMKIHITEDSKALLDSVGGFIVEPRNPRITREGLPYQTYWLERS